MPIALMRRYVVAASSTSPVPPSADAMPWPTYPMIYRVSSAHEEGCERVYAVNTECFLGDDDGNLRALRAHEVEQKTVDGRMVF